MYHHMPVPVSNEHVIPPPGPARRPEVAATGYRPVAEADPLERPTPEVRALLERASDATEVLERLDRRLTFVADDAGAPLHAELRDGSGQLLHRLSITDALTLLDGLGRR
jgi:hypothetical protein